MNELADIGIALFLLTWIIIFVYLAKARANKVIEYISLGELMEKADYNHTTGLWTCEEGKCYELISKNAKDEVLYREAEYSEYEYTKALHSLTDDKHGS